MNIAQQRRETQAIQRRYEDKYFPLVKSAIRSKVDEVIAVVKNQSIQAAISHLDRQSSNTAVTQIIQTMAMEVGLRFARKEWKNLQDQKRGAGRKMKHLATRSVVEIPVSDYILTEPIPVKSIYGLETKGISDWANWIRNWLFDFIVEKISFSVFETTKDVLFTVLNNAIKGGWGIDKTIQALDELPLSASQASRIVRTEITRASNAGASAAAETFPYQMQKHWISAHDTRVRGFNPEDHASHIGLDGQVVDYEDVFIDPRNGHELRWPGDPEAPPVDTVNCRCKVVHVAKRDLQGNMIPKKNVIISFPSRRMATL